MHRRRKGDGVLEDILLDMSDKQFGFHIQTIIIKLLSLDSVQIIGESCITRNSCGSYSEYFLVVFIK